MRKYLIQRVLLKTWTHNFMLTIMKRSLTKLRSMIVMNKKLQFNNDPKQTSKLARKYLKS